MKDPYEILGVARTATEDEIRSAYRKLAKQHHPDLNPGKPEAEGRFKEVSVAYGLLGDAEKRARFDRGEIDASGAERPPQRPFYRDFANQAGRDKYRREDVFEDVDLESFFADAIKAQNAQNARRRARGADVQYELEVGFLDAAGGKVTRIAMPDGKTLDVRIPAGVADGQVLRLKGQGMPGAGDKAVSGDALILIHVAPHPAFRRDGDDVILELPVTLKEAILGAKIEVPTAKGAVTLTIPPNSSAATKLRLKGRGIAEGDQYVVLKPVLPREAEPELAAFLATWTPQDKSDPRAGVVTP
jgi:DnaJ-class molecular chaperone